MTLETELLIAAWDNWKKNCVLTHDMVIASRLKSVMLCLEDDINEIIDMEGD